MAEGKDRNKHSGFQLLSKLITLIAHKHIHTHVAIYTVIKLLISLCIKRFYISVSG